MNQKEAVHERLKEYACVAPDQMMQKLQINARGDYAGGGNHPATEIWK